MGTLETDCFDFRLTGKYDTNDGKLSAELSKEKRLLVFFYWPADALESLFEQRIWEKLVNRKNKEDPRKGFTFAYSY